MHLKIQHIFKMRLRLIALLKRMLCLQVKIMLWQRIPNIWTTIDL